MDPIEPEVEPISEVVEEEDLVDPVETDEAEIIEVTPEDEPVEEE